VSDRSSRAAKIMVSGCLNGPPIRFNRSNVDVHSDIWDRWAAEGRLVPFCAELAAGMAVPRPPAETVGGDGGAVIAGGAKVLEDSGDDVTDLFLDGARKAVRRARDRGCVAAVLVDGSPSCGSTYVYDGSFSGATVEGMGVTARMLADAGIAVFSEHQIEEADAFVRAAEAG
jgi:uncharacterized protein YbbK (DUF523 family)